MTDPPRLFDSPEAQRVPPGEPPRPVRAHTYADGLPGHEAPPTSRAAAAAALPRAGRDAARVLAAITDAPDGLTDDEGEVLLGLRHTTYSARRRGLVLDGHVVDSGARRPTSAGRPAVVWKKAAR